MLLGCSGVSGLNVALSGSDLLNRKLFMDVDGAVFVFVLFGCSDISLGILDGLRDESASHPFQRTDIELKT